MPKCKRSMTEIEPTADEKENEFADVSDLSDVPVTDLSDVPDSEKPAQKTVLAYTADENFITNINPLSSRLVWRPTNKTKTFYILYEKHEQNKIDPCKISLPGQIGKFFNLTEPSQYGRWQIKLHLDREVFSQVESLLRLRPFSPLVSDEISVAIRTNDPALKECDGVDSKGSFPFLYDGTVPDSNYTDYSISPDNFDEGTEVVTRCIFTAYNIKGRSGFAFKLLEILKIGEDSTMDDGLILGDFSLFPKKRRIDKGKEKQR